MRAAMDFNNKRKGMEKVLAFRTELLDRTGCFDGLSFDVEKYFKVFKAPGSLYFIDRDQAEEDPTHKQIIPYSILAHEDQILFYRRSKEGDARLHTKASIGVGGHINPKDAPDLGKWDSIIARALKREVFEEFRLSGFREVSHLALINDDSNSVGSVHFGVVNLVGLRDGNVSIRNSEIDRCELMGIGEIESRREDLESWSRICLDGIDWDAVFRRK